MCCGKWAALGATCSDLALFLEAGKPEYGLNMRFQGVETSTAILVLMNRNNPPWALQRSQLKLPAYLLNKYNTRNNSVNFPKNLFLSLKAIVFLWYYKCIWSLIFSYTIKLIACYIQKLEKLDQPPGASSLVSSYIL